MSDAVTRRCRGERGMAMVTGLVLLFAFTAAGVVWLAVDVNRSVSNRTSAQSIAFQAARSGAQQLGVAALRADAAPVIEYERARQAARSTAEELLGGYQLEGVVVRVTILGVDAVEVEVRIVRSGWRCHGSGSRPSRGGVVMVRAQCRRERRYFRNPPHDAFIPGRERSGRRRIGVMPSTPHGSRAAALIRSLTTLIVVTVVLPVALAMVSERRFGGRAPWHGLPSPSSWRLGGLPDAVTGRLTERIIADVVIRGTLMLTWLAIVLFAITVVAELAHMIRHGGIARPEIRGLGWSQGSARTVAAGLLVVLPMFASPACGLAGSDRGVLAHDRAPAVHILESTDPGTASECAVDTTAATPERAARGSGNWPLRRWDR